MLSTIQGVPWGNVNILGGHTIGHSEQKTVYVHVSYSERFPRYSSLDLSPNIVLPSRCTPTKKEAVEYR